MTNPSKPVTAQAVDPMAGARLSAAQATNASTDPTLALKSADACGCVDAWGDALHDTRALLEGAAAIVEGEPLLERSDALLSVVRLVRLAIADLDRLFGTIDAEVARPARSEVGHA